MAVIRGSQLVLDHHLRTRTTLPAEYIDRKITNWPLAFDEFDL